MKTHFFSLLNIVIPGVVMAAFIVIPVQDQQPARIKIIQADQLRFERRFGQDVRRLIGDVVLEHDGVLMHCDSAHMHEATNSFEAFSRVKISSGDTLFLYGDYLRYNGNTRIAEIFNNVKLVDDNLVLTTEQLNYDRNNGIAYYERNGKITDPDNTLTSLSGYYMTREKRAHFRKDVVLVNPDYIMRSDTLVYHTESQVAMFFGPTDIEADETFIYCENGWYDTRNDNASFSRNAFIVSGEHNIRGDSLYYERPNESARAFNNVVIVDTAQNVILRGNYGEYYKFLGYTFITDTPEAIFFDNADSLFLHADTVWAMFTQDQQIETVKAYYNVRYFRNDFQGACDSLVYRINDSIIAMYRNPVIWTGENQLTADSIHIKTDGEAVKYMTLFNSAFMANRSDSLQFNQVKGRNMTGYFNEGRLDYIVVSGNAQTIYYAKEEDGYLIGINLAEASRMRIELEENKIRRIFYFESPGGTMFPDKEVTANQRILQGFNWMDAKRPRSREDIFIRD